MPRIGDACKNQRGFALIFLRRDVALSAEWIASVSTQPCGAINPFMHGWPPPWHRTGMTDRHKRRLLHLDRWQRLLPGWAGRVLRWLRKPSARWFRIPAGLLLVAFGLLGFLPILGFWMLIPGLLLLSLDLPFLRLPMRVVIVRARTWLRQLGLWRRTHSH